jgi:hypothetical protein
MDFNTSKTDLMNMTKQLRRNAFLLTVIFGLFSHLLVAQADLGYYLPEGVGYKKDVPTPASVMGHEVGEWHATHDKLVHYFYELASSSPRVRVEKIGQTYEYRPLLNVIITSEENHGKIEEIRRQHLQLSDPAQSESLDIRKMPVVVRLGYSIHGNEASGANASLLTAYHLAAATGPEIEAILKNCVILIDPSLNPDGMQRFSTWANEHKSKNLNPDPNSREFQEPWPNGRTNHYWFDLNRDWLLAQHPESIARLKVYHDWLPNVQTDHHEMESDGTFFFQPGIPSAKNPLIPDDNVVLTEKIARYHAASLDENKRLYYTKESFDDFYLGKGSTYPDFKGGIGILFEQASVRGHLRETDNGLLSFPFAIKNHFITSLSTIKASLEMKDELLAYQRAYFKNSLADAKKGDKRAIVFGTQEDPARAVLLGQLLRRHQIDLYKPAKDLTINGTSFFADKSFILPLDQKQYKMIKAIFDRMTTFQDSLFYDISAWNLDLAFNTKMERVSDLRSLGGLGEKVGALEMPSGEVTGGKGYAYVMDWQQYFAPAVLNALLKKGMILKVAHEDFTTSDGLSFDRGAVLIPVGLQGMGENEVYDLLEKNSLKYHVKIQSINSGLSAGGIDLGSSNFQAIQRPVIAMLVDESVSGYEAGEVWHLLDQRYDIYQTMIQTGDLDRVKLDRYNVLLLPSGSYSNVGTASQQKIMDWVKNGGTVVAWRDALRFLTKLKIADLKFEKPYKIDSSAYSYAEREKARGAQYIGGAIFEVDLDVTHPLAYGYSESTLPVFKKGDLVLEHSKGNRTNPFTYTDKPLLSGYVSDENLRRISESPAVTVASFGQGKVIALADDPNFRAFWYGTNRLMMNAIFWGDMISTR